MIADYRAEHLKAAGYTVERAHFLYEKFPAWSVFAEDALVMAGGFITPHDGLVEAWAIPGPAFRSHVKEALQASKDALIWSLPIGTRRVQALVMSDHANGHRWAKHLGFTRESEMPKYGKNGEDVTMYVLFPGGRMPWMAG
jgi:hypothetical protein